MRRRCEELLERRRAPPPRGLVAWSPPSAIAALTWKAITAPDGVADPTAPGAHLAHGAVVTNSALLVFREGLEAVLVLAAFTASFVGANRRLRRPVAAGAATGAPRVGRHLVRCDRGDRRARRQRARRPGARPGLLAVAVLLVVMNWFFHKIYWTGWIAAHNRTPRRRCSAPAGRAR